MTASTRSIVLLDAAREELERLQRASSTAAGLSRRARAVLLLADALPIVEIARRTGYTRMQIHRIRGRFLELGVDGLQDRPRSGRPTTISARQRAQVVALTLRRPPSGLTHWTTRDLGRQANVSHMTVHRLWRAHALQPHRLKTFKFTTDPLAEEKIYDIAGLYLNPPTQAVVLSLDEKTQIQALNRTQPLLPLRPGLPAYRRHGLTSLFAALEVANGRVIGACHERHTSIEFLGFLRLLARRYRGRELHVILDNSSTHSTAAVQEWLADHPLVTFHYTPKGASWMNLVEAWFGVLTRKSIRRGSFASVRQLVRHIQQYIERWNDHPTPFVWTKEPADIIRKAVRR